MLSVERRTVDVVSLAGRAVSAVTAPPRRVTGRQPDRCARVGARRVPLELCGREGGGPEPAGGGGGDAFRMVSQG